MGVRVRSYALGALVGLAAACSGSGSGSGGAEGTTGGSSGGAGAPSAADAGAVTDAAAAVDAGDARGNAAATEFTPPTGAQAEQAARLYADGDAAYRRGDLAAAAQAFRQLYDLYPAAGMAFNVARVYERMGEVDQALHYFDVVLRANPEPAQRQEVERHIALIHAYQQRSREGVAQPMPTDEATSQEGFTWFQRGVALFRRRQYSQALIAFEQAYQYLQTPELYFNLGVTHERLGNTDRALEFLRDYLNSRIGTPEEGPIRQRIEALERRR